MAQGVQMVGQRRRRVSRLRLQRADCEAVSSGLHEQAVQLQPMRMCEGLERGNCI